ncbi:hypothetical protein FRX31_012494, partial [Thalictrum thalictroides]
MMRDFEFSPLMNEGLYGNFAENAVAVITQTLLKICIITLNSCSPLAIFKYVTESPAEEIEERVKLGLKILWKLVFDGYIQHHK